jgi:hypothetical protein
MAPDGQKVLPPAFTGDLLFHERLDLLLKKAYSMQNIGNTVSFTSVITNILAEIYRYMEQSKARLYREKLKILKVKINEFNFRKNKVVTSSKEESAIFIELEDVLFDLVVEAHVAKLILKDKGGMDEAFGDM